MLRTITILVLAFTFTTAHASEIDIPAFFSSLKAMHTAIEIVTNEYITPDMNDNARALAHQVKWDWLTIADDAASSPTDLITDTANRLARENKISISTSLDKNLIVFARQDYAACIKCCKKLIAAQNIKTTILNQTTLEKKTMYIKKHADQYVQIKKDIDAYILDLMKKADPSIQN